MAQASWFIAGRRRLAIAILAPMLALGVAPTPTYAAAVPTVTAVGASYAHTCALTSRGAVKCWGSNSHGQLGNGTTIDSSLPVDVGGISHDAIEVAVGIQHTCALASGGSVKCWGNNESGQLGDGTTINSSLPVDVSGLGPGIRAITAGGSYVCALTSGGAVKCWGYNSTGNIGNATTTNSSVPVDVLGLPSGIVALDAGFYQTCVLTGNGAVLCWGYGNGPAAVAGLDDGVVAISVGEEHACAVTASGGVRCWGNNQYGQLGDGSRIAGPRSVDVVGLPSRAIAVSAGSIHTCALLSSGAVTCWGYNAYGQLGDGSLTSSNLPVGVSGMSGGVSSISTGGNHTCAVMNSGAVKCWGRNSYGQLGRGSLGNSRVPVAVDFVTYRTISMLPSVPAGRIARGTPVTLRATVSPVRPTSDRPVVRFEIYRQDNGIWRRTAHRDVVADATGRATLRWTFATTGARYVRARALQDSSYGASPWSPTVSYSVQ